MVTTAWNTGQLAALESAIASGATSVSYEGKTVQYRSIDEMLSDDAVRVRYALGKEWRDVRVRSAVGQFARDEAVSKCRRVRCKALCPTDFVSFESIGEYRQVFSIEALANSSDLIGRYFQPCWLLEWQ